MASAKARSPTSIIERIVNVAVTLCPSSLRRARRVIRRAWGRVRWKLVAIIILTLTSTVLVASLAIATLNVVVRRESTHIVEKQIQTLVQASRRIAPAVLDRAGTCVVPSPRWTSENRPYVDTSKPANGAEPEQQYLYTA